MKLSYAITVKDEFQEIQNLITLLTKYKNSDSEIVVLFDTKNGTEEVQNYLDSILEKKLVSYVIKSPFENNYSSHKNKLFDYCKGKYIIFLDADELISEFFLLNIQEILELNPNVDVFAMPRINTVEGLTEKHIIKWNWKISKLDNYTSEKILDETDEEYKFFKKYNLIIEEKNV